MVERCELGDFITCDVYPHCVVIDSPWGRSGADRGTAGSSSLACQKIWIRDNVFHPWSYTWSAVRLPDGTLRNSYKFSFSHEEDAVLFALRF